LAESTFLGVKMKFHWAMVGLLICLVGCEDGCSTSAPEPEPFPGTILGAQCRPIARSNVVHPLDDSGERFFVGGEFGEHGGDIGYAGLLVTLDGGHTYRNVFTIHGSDARGAFAYRVRQAQLGWWLGSGRLALVVPPPTNDDTASADGYKDWMVYSEDDGRTYALQVADFGTFLVPNGTPGNRRWRFGSVTIVSNGDVYSVSQDSEQTWKELPVPVDLKADQVGFTTDYSWTAPKDADDVLTFYGKDQFPEFEGLRLNIVGAAGTDEYLINFGELPAARVLSLLSRDKERFRIAVLLEAESLKWPYRVLCDVGPDLEPSYVPLPELKPLADVQPGELASYARPRYHTSGSGSTIHFLRVTPSQRVYVMTRKSIASGDFQGTPINNAFTRHSENDVWDDIRQLEAPVFASDESLGILYQKDDWSRGLRIFDMVTGEWISEDALSSYRTIPDSKEFYGSTEGLGISFASTGLYIEPGFGSAVEIRPWTGAGNKPAALLYGGLNFISGRNLIRTRAHRELGLYRDRLFDMYILKADAVSGQSFDPGVCIEAPEREDCAILRGSQASVILTDRNGRLVALDPDFRRIIKHRPDLGPDQWDVVVDGLHRPSDFTLMHRHGRVFALILDGDVLAVDIDSPETITRRLP